MQQSSFVGLIFYQLSLCMSKISILLLYIRVLQYQLACRAAWAMLAVVIIYNTWGFICTMTQCSPLESYWDFSIKGECRPIVYMWAVIGLHIATDFLIFFIPIPVVFKMRIPWRTKLGLILIFALGFLYGVPPFLLTRHMF